MDGPGISLFQGNDSINLNTSNQREEEEFLEDAKARKAELDALINGAFSDLDDDLNGDTDISISSSHCSRPGRSEHEYDIDHIRATNTSNYSGELYYPLSHVNPQVKPIRDSYNGNPAIANHKGIFKGNGYDNFSESNHVSAHKNHCVHSHSLPSSEEQETEHYKQTDFNGSEQIQVLYEVRLREIERLNKELAAEKEEKAQILRKLNVSEHDKKNLEISLNANKTLLGETRNKISDLENEISMLKNKAEELKKSEDKVRSELEITRTQLVHEQQKFAALQRCDLNTNLEKQMNMAMEMKKAEHKSELLTLQQQLNSALERLDKKTDDFNALEKKLYEMEEKYAVHLLNKCDSVMRQESTTKALLDEANQEKLELTRQLNALQQEYTLLKNDLEQYDSFPSLKLNEHSSSDDKTNDSYRLMSYGWRSESKEKNLNLNQSDLVIKLKDELHRALMSQRTKRMEIAKLKEEVQSKQQEVNELKEQERNYLTQIESLKKEMTKSNQLAEKYTAKEQDSQLLAKLQSDIVELEKDNSLKKQKIVSLEKEIRSLNEKMIDIAQENKNYDGQYLEFYENELAKVKTDSESLLKEKELEWGREMEKLMTECDEIKKCYLDIKNKKDEISKKLLEVTKVYEETKKEKDSLESQLLIKHQEIEKLKDNIILMGKEKMTNEENSLKSVQRELNGIVEKQTKEINMLKLKLQDVAKTDEELMKLKDEISQSKLRYIELEKTLKEEFQESLIKLKEENSLLKENLKKREAELSLRKMCVESQKNNVAVGTDDTLIIDKLNDQNLAAIENLEKEINQLRALDQAKAQEILKLTLSQEQKLNEQLQQLESKLTYQHQQEIILAEKKMKDLSLKYFSEEMEKLQKQHSDSIKALRDEDYKKLNEFQQLLARKEEEIKTLTAKKEQLEGALQRYEEERQKTGVIVTQWAKEVDLIRQEKDQLREDIDQLKMNNAQSSEEYERLKAKLKETKKAALVYKRRVQEVKTSLSEKYKNLMMDLQQKVDDVVSAKEKEIHDKLLQIEKEYKIKEKHLRLEDKDSDII